MPERNLLAPEDIYGFRWVSDPQISPDGGKVAYVLTWLERDSDEYRSSIYIAQSDGGAEPRRFTSGPKKDSNPRWSPDGRQLLFVSDRENKAQAYVMPSDGGEARRLTSAENGVSGPEWSPDGKSIAFISTTGYSADEDLKDVVSYHYTEARFKNDGAGIKRGRSHLFVQSVDSMEAKQLTSGDDDYSSPAWSPDGKTVAVVSEQDERRPFVPASDIYLIPIEGGAPKRITPGKGPSNSPVFSPDGMKIAYFGHQNPPDTGITTNNGLWVVPVEGGKPTLITEGWDRSAGNDVNSDSRMGVNDLRPVWSEDTLKLYFAAGDRGMVHLFTADASEHSVEAIVRGERVIEGFSIAGDKIAFTASEMLNPGDVYIASLDGTDEKRLTCVNRDYLDGFVLSSPEEVLIDSTEGTKVHGWIIKPVGSREGEKYPLIVEIHGGPQTQYGHSFFHEFQVLAARGYGVLFVNPRGSSGYGQQFTSCIAKQWGERDYQDIMATTDWAQSQPWVDSGRMGVVGGSYGGFMTNWIVGHTDRFRAAITQRCLSNFASFYGTSDIGPYFSEWNVGGTPWDNAEGYRRSSPISYIERMKTPLLIIHSEEDHRCPIEQSEQLFVGLKRLGIDTEFLRFPQESHGLSRGGKAKRRIERLERILDWFDRFLLRA